MDKKKKYIGISIGVIVLALIIGVLAFKPALTSADEKDLGTIKEELKEELSKEYDAKFEEQQKKIDELSKKLDDKEAELKKAIQDGDKNVESKITYDTTNKNREDDMKKDPDKYIPPSSSSGSASISNSKGIEN